LPLSPFFHLSRAEIVGPVNDADSFFSFLERFFTQFEALGLPVPKPFFFLSVVKIFLFTDRRIPDFFFFLKKGKSFPFLF